MASRSSLISRSFFTNIFWQQYLMVRAQHGSLEARRVVDSRPLWLLYFWTTDQNRLVLCLQSERNITSMKRFLKNTGRELGKQFQRSVKTLEIRRVWTIEASSHRARIDGQIEQMNSSMNWTNALFPMGVFPPASQFVQEPEKWLCGRIHTKFVC